MPQPTPVFLVFMPPYFHLLRPSTASDFYHTQRHYPAIGHPVLIHMLVYLLVRQRLVYYAGVVTTLLLKTFKYPYPGAQ